MYLFKKTLLATAISSAVMLTAACSSSDSTSASGEEINGTVFASYVSGASVTVTDENGNTIAGPVTTNANGEFSLRIPAENLLENLIFMATGGQYKDEATGETTANTELAAFIASETLSGSNTYQFSVSPDSTIIKELVAEHGLTLENARTRFEDAFGYEADHSIIPVDATIENTSAEDSEKLAGLRAAAFSQLTNDLGLPAASQGALLELLAEDIADGEFDGKGNDQTDLSLGNFVAGLDLQNRFSQALVNFRDGNDASGLSNTELGTFPFSNVAISENYIVTMVTESAMIHQGKSSFQLQITDHLGNAATGLQPMLMPMMNMAAHHHSTPSLAISESNTPGTYDATVYYVMASFIASGDAMGYWDLKLTIGDDELHFFPTVMMNMGATVHAALRGQGDDTIAAMGGGETKRRYEIFKDSLSTGDNGTDFSVFIAARESGMSFPALMAPMTLNEGSEAYQLEVESVTVRMSTDETNWETAETSGNGIWTATGLNFASDMNQAIYVEVSVNGEQKTDDGQAPDGIADTAMFSLSASSDEMSMDDHDHSGMEMDEHSDMEMNSDESNMSMEEHTHSELDSENEMHMAM